MGIGKTLIKKMTEIYAKNTKFKAIIL